MVTLSTRLPDGREVPTPPCPRCGATGRHCLRPSEHEIADRWHDERETLLARLCGCPEVCAPWLARLDRVAAAVAAQPRQEALWP